MIIKYINPIFNMPHITEFEDAYITHDLDEDGNELEDFVLMINCTNEYEYCLCIKGATFEKLVEIMNELYYTGKIDLSTDSNINISAFPKAFSYMESSGLSDIADLSGLTDDDDFNDSFMDEDYYND